MARTTTKKTAIDKAQLLTDKIIKLIEDGVKPWEKPWQGVGYGNAITGHQYRGANPLIAKIDTLIHGYDSPLFLSFNQGKELGWQLKKGSKSTWLLWASKGAREFEDPTTGEIQTKHFFAEKWLQVFNLDCFDDTASDKKKEKYAAGRGTNAEPRLDLAEKFVKSQNAIIRHGGDEAYYSPALDRIQMPPYAAFSSAAAYYATLNHELSHWTGHENRLNRLTPAKFGSENYAFEELIAELSAAFVCNNLGIETSLENHASYLDSWLTILKKDNQAFLKAVKLGQKASKYLLENAEMLEEEPAAA